MDELGLVGNLAVVAVAALVGGALARLLRLPTILGYLAAGLLIGPNTPGFVGDVDEVQTVADLGVALLMFTLGIRFSLRELAAVGKIAVGGALSQVAAMVGVGFLVAWALGLGTNAGFLIGAVVSMSSSVVALRLLEERGEIGGPAGRVAMPFSLVQDLTAVPLIIMIPVLAGEEENILVELGLAAAKGIGVIALVWVVGGLILPRVFPRVALGRSRELFLLSVVALALGTASVSFLAGLSLAFGAFLAGLLVSESEYAHQTLAEVFPLREVFAVVFFVSIGMLIDPVTFVDDTEIVLTVAAVGILVKVVLISAIALGFRYPLKTAVTAGLALGTMAEFSFVLAREGATQGLVDLELNSAILAAVLLSIAVSPLLFMAQEPLFAVLRRTPVIGPLLVEPAEVYVPEPATLVNHVVICGFDQAGQELAAALSPRGFRFLVVDQDPVIVRRLRSQDVPCVLGDPALISVLEQAYLERARVLAVTLSDAAQVEAVVAAARSINPKLDIVARGGEVESHLRLRHMGAAEVVHAEFEAGMEFVRHTLHRFGVPSQEVLALLARRRRDYYTEE